MMSLSWPLSLASMVWVRPKATDSVVSLRPGLEISLDKLLNDLWLISSLNNNDIDFNRGISRSGPGRLPTSRWTLSSRIFSKLISVRLRLTGQVLGEVDHLFSCHSLCDQWRPWYDCENSRRTKLGQLAVFEGNKLLKPSVMISKCYAKWVIPTVLKTTHTWMDGRRASLYASWFLGLNLCNHDWWHHGANWERHNGDRSRKNAGWRP